MNSQVFRTQVSNSIHMDEIGREKAALWDELCLWREWCVQYLQFVTKYEHPNRFLRETHE